MQYLTKTDDMNNNPIFTKITAMKKTTQLGLVVAALTLSQAGGALYVQTVDNIDWNAAMWGSPASAPTAGNNYESAAVGGNNRFRISASGASSTFAGDNLTLVTGTTALNKTLNGNTSTVTGTLTLDGGNIVHAPNAGSIATLATGGFVVTGTGSTIGLAYTGNSLSITGGLSGTGDLLLDYQDVGAVISRTLSFGSVGAYTGTISVTEKVQLDFGSDVDFGGNLAIDSDSFLNIDQSITIARDALTFDGSVIAAGIYSGTDLTDLGAGFLDGGGTLTVLPEPSSIALLGLGGAMALLRRRR